MARSPGARIVTDTPAKGGGSMMRPTVSRTEVKPGSRAGLAKRGAKVPKRRGKNIVGC